MNNEDWLCMVHILHENLNPLTHLSILALSPQSMLSLWTPSFSTVIYLYAIQDGRLQYPGRHTLPSVSIYIPDGRL